jgi:hypothetical protein
MPEVSWIATARADPGREYLALVTYLPRKRYRSISGLIRDTGAIRNQLNDSRGLVGYSLRAQLLGKKAWTLSVWEDEDALQEFVRKTPHVDIMKSFGPELGQERKFVRWTLLGSDVPPTWDQALEQLQKG